MNDRGRINTPNKDYPLLPGEQLISIVDHPVRQHQKIPSTTEQILRLTRATHTAEIGQTGPSLAAIALANSDDDTPGHLKLYEAVFGRDSLRVAIDLMSSYPELARSTVLSLANLQGVFFNDSREEEPGRIVHEARERFDPIARDLSRRLGWGWPYYGSVDATPDFIRTLAAYTKLSEENHAFLSETYIDRADQERTIAYALDSALNWISSRRARNDEGFIEFNSILPLGIENQVWKDSWDAYHHSDGTLANHALGIASLEVQVTTYDALIDSAELFENVFDDSERAASLRQEAAELRESILEYLWTEDKGGYFVLGTDRSDAGDLRQLKIRTSNMGHVLNSRLLEGNDPEITRKRTATIGHIMSPEILCKSGIRTLASDERRFRPGAYHNGSVWLWDTHHIAKGLRRHGYKTEGDDIDRRVLLIVEKTRMFPEYVRGEQDDIAVNQQTVTLWDETKQRNNVVEQPPQEVQAWTVAAIRNIKTHIGKKSD